MPLPNLTLVLLQRLLPPMPHVLCELWNSWVLGWSKSTWPVKLNKAQCVTCIIIIITYEYIIITYSMIVLDMFYLFLLFVLLHYYYIIFMHYYVIHCYVLLLYCYCTVIKFLLHIIKKSLLNIIAFFVTTSLLHHHSVLLHIHYYLLSQNHYYIFCHDFVNIMSILYHYSQLHCYCSLFPLLPIYCMLPTWQFADVVLVRVWAGDRVSIQVGCCSQRAFWQFSSAHCREMSWRPQ